MLEIKGIFKTYDKGLSTENSLFKDLSLTVDQGEFVSVVGSNGSGKTSLLNVIAGTIPMDGGQIIMDGINLGVMPEYRRAARISRVFQDPKMGTCASMTVAENMALSANKGRRYGLRWALHRADKDEYKKLLQTLNMSVEDKVDVLCGQLSGGQRQALALLMSTMTRPDLLLLDEHTAALDPRTSETIMELTREVIESRGITALMVTHNLEYAIRYGNRLIMLHKGNILLDVKGEKKMSLTIPDLVALFKDAQGGVLTDTMVFT